VTDDPDLEAVLLRAVEDAHLPPEEPISRWLAHDPGVDALKLRAHDHALLVGACGYHVHRDTGWVEVRDYSDHPRAMRSQVYQPDRPGQPYMPPARPDVMPSTEP
jgi:hypothetical protein